VCSIDTGTWLSVCILSVSVWLVVNVTTQWAVSLKDRSKRVVVESRWSIDDARLHGSVAHDDTKQTICCRDAHVDLLFPVNGEVTWPGWRENDAMNICTELRMCTDWPRMSNWQMSDTGTPLNWAVADLLPISRVWLRSPKCTCKSFHFSYRLASYRVFGFFLISRFILISLCLYQSYAYFVHMCANPLSVFVYNQIRTALCDWIEDIVKLYLVIISNLFTNFKKLIMSAER